MVVVIYSIDGRVGGQISKTVQLVDELKKSGIPTDEYNVLQVKKNPVKAFYRFIKIIKSSETVLIVLASRGYFLLLPLLILFSNLFNTQVYECVIGGIRYQYLTKHRFRKYLERKVNKIYVETSFMKQEYEKIGFHNVEVQSNFKKTVPIKMDELEKRAQSHTGLKICTFSRIDRHKGIDSAIAIIEKAAEKHPEKEITLDIYGPIDNEYEADFQNLLASANNRLIHYIGVVPSSQSVDCLKNYDLLLFPTKWKTEGFPATFIDAFSAGLPVISSNKSNFSDIVIQGVNGYFAEENNLDEFTDRILFLAENRDKLYEMQREAVASSAKYNPDRVLAPMINELKRIEMKKKAI